MQAGGSASDSGFTPVDCRSLQDRFYFSFYSFKLNIHERSGLLGTVWAQRTKKSRRDRIRLRLQYAHDAASR